VGTHISRVRSVNLDVWTEEETACMRELSGNGGNVYGEGDEEGKEGGKEETSDRSFCLLGDD
jgi:hypothetical protein